MIKGQRFSDLMSEDFKRDQLSFEISFVIDFEPNLTTSLLSQAIVRGDKIG